VEESNPNHFGRSTLLGGSWPLLSSIKKIDWTHPVSGTTLANSGEAHSLALVQIHSMKLAGFFLLAAGWIIVLAAVVLLGSAMPRTAFVLAGIGVEILGLALVIRAHMVPSEEQE
jgi:hypothetical protein